ncbi:MAG TPA: helix-turn-helix domain-containing protein [Vicinamibacterales bacterium]|jgi:DNA-binding HxlR family transcriptional regulator
MPNKPLRRTSRAGRTARGTLRSPCPIAGALDLVGDRWTLLVMRDILLYDRRRFADFLAAPEHIASNILADRLERLERCGLIERRRYADHPPREEYHPTTRGWDLAPVLRELIRWGQRHVPGTAKRPPAGVSARGVRLMHEGTGRRS